MASRSRQLRRLFRENPKCHWCGRTTFIYERKGKEKPPKRSATRDHLVMKKDRVKGEKAEIVLACYECNHRRSIVQAAECMGGIHKERRLTQLKRDWRKGFYW